MQSKFCLIIPIFRHVKQLQTFLEHKIETLPPTILIDDGNELEDRELLKMFTERHGVHLVSHPHNLGKGAAIKTGLKVASSLGFTHAVQVDADGQHDLDDIQKFIQESIKYPKALILGVPIFDDSAPLCRVYGRKLTTAIIQFETFSTKVKDALFGFRIYPLKETLEITDKVKTSNRMGFDPEIIVRFCWQGFELRTINSRVTYPKEGYSNFRYIPDNLQFIMLHFRLICLGIKMKIDQIFSSGFTKKVVSPDDEKWYNKTERGSVFALKVVLMLYKFGGKSLLKALLHPVIFYFFLIDSLARKSSREFLSEVNRFKPETHPSPSYRLIYKHFYRFGLKIISSIQAWLGDIHPESIDWNGHQQIYDMIDKGKGGLILGAHFGCMEVCRAIKHNKEGLNVVPLMYLKNAKIFRNFLNEINPSSTQEIIQIENIHPGIAIDLHERISNGQFISLLADRLSAGSNDRYVKVSFLGRDAFVPEGPFALAYSLNCDIISFFSYYSEKKGKYQVFIKIIEKQTGLTKTEKRVAIAQVAQKFFSELERHCLVEPLEWFNFFPFWKLSSETKV